MKVIEQKKLMLKDTIEFFESKGFKYNESYEHTFTKKLNSGGIKLSLFFSDVGESNNSLYSLSLYKVEEIMLQIGVPYNNWVKEKKGKKLLYTVYDIFTDFQFTRRTITIGSEKAKKIIYINNPEDVGKWKEALFSYVENEGMEFIEKYSHIPNILAEMDKIDQSNGHTYTPFILGRIDHLFRALIISKLCNDPKYLERKERFDNIILQQKYEKWHPYYERLKEKLEMTDPIYNVGDDNT